MRRNQRRFPAGGGRRAGGGSLIGDLCRNIQKSGVDISLSIESIADDLRRFHMPYRRVKNFDSHVATAVFQLRSASAGESSGRRGRDDDSADTMTPSVSGTSEDQDSSFDEVGRSMAFPEEGGSAPYDYTKEALRDAYVNLAKKRRIAEGLEIEVANEQSKKEIAAPLSNSGGAIGGNVGDKAAVRDSSARTEREELRSSYEDGGEENVRFKDLGGMEELLDQLLELVVIPLCHPEIPRKLGGKPITGLLLRGPPGCGKTTLAHAIANEAGVPFYQIGLEVISGVSGESEENIRTLFNKARRTAPSVIFIDEIDTIASKREGLQKGMELRIVSQLMMSIDECHRSLESRNSDSENSQTIQGHVLVIAATNNPDAVEGALRRPGRFDMEIALEVPKEMARLSILKKLIYNKINGDFDLSAIARSTSGFVAADLKQVVHRAVSLATSRVIKKRKSCFDSLNERWWNSSWEGFIETEGVTMADFEEAVNLVQPSLRREGFSSIPTVTWNDVGGLDKLKEDLMNSIVNPIKYPEIYKEFKISMNDGIMLFGPPGCGKTLIAQAVANESGANFIYIKGAELLNKYVGESELAVRKLFDRARTNAPCILFLDEVDALSNLHGEEGGVVHRVVKSMLIEMDGIEPREGVYVIGAANRIENVHPAFLRPGRFEQRAFVPLPGPHERASIMKAHARERPIAADVDLDALARREECNNFTGADIASLIKAASKAAVEEILKQENPEGPHSIQAKHFEVALSKIKPSVSKEDRKHYKLMWKRYCGSI